MVKMQRFEMNISRALLQNIKLHNEMYTYLNHIYLISKKTNSKKRAMHHLNIIH